MLKTKTFSFSFLLIFSLKDSDKHVSSISHTFLNQSRENHPDKYADLIVQTLQSKFESDKEKDKQMLTQLTHKFANFFGLPTANRQENLRNWLVQVVIACFEYVIDDLENRADFFKLATQPFLFKVSIPLTI